MALIFADPFAASLHDILILAVFGLIFAFASITLSEGARRLAPGEAALISALETPLAIVWAWVFFAEWPALMGLIGGALILLAVFGSQLAALVRKPAD